MSMSFDEVGGFSLDDIVGQPVPTAPVGNVEPTVEVDEIESVDVTMDSGITRTFTSDVPQTFDPACKVAEAITEADRIKAILDPKLEREKEITKEVQRLKEELNRKIDELNLERQQIMEDTFDLRRDLRNAQLAIKTAMRDLERALEAQRLSEMYLNKSQTFDELTVNMPWRDKIFPHQIEGAKQIALAESAILGDKMGLGKSLTSLAAADMLMVKRLLIIVPDDVVTNFVNEVHYWAPHRNIVMLGKLPKASRHMAADFLKSLDEYTVVLNYSAWRRDSMLLDKLIQLRFEMAILDEAHTVKETTTNAYRGVREVLMADNSCPDCRSPIKRVPFGPGDLTDENGRHIHTYKDEGFECLNEACGWSEKRDIVTGQSRDFGAFRSIRYVVPMTGTVILNKPTDIYALLSLIQPEVYTSKREFERQYCFTDYDNKVKFKAGGMDSLAKKLAGRYIARDRNSAGVKLPKQTIQFHNIEMDEELYPKQAKVIKQLTQHAMIMLENGKQLPILAIIALITRKRQANVWPAGIQLKDEDGVVVFSVGDDVNESIKLDKIITPTGEEGLLPELTGDGDMINGERVVVFSQFKGPLAELERRCREHGISAVRFDGDTPQDIRNQVKIDFDRKMCEQEGYEPKWQVVLCNYKTGGVGLNFTAATQMIILDEEWNPGKATQAFARIDRMGQTEETTVHVLQLEKSVDTWMRALNEEKEAMINGFENANQLAGILMESMRNGEI